MAIRPPTKHDRINELVGNRTGRTSHVSRPTTKSAIEGRRVRANTGAGKKAISTLVKHGGGKISAGARKQHDSWFGAGSGTDLLDPYSGTQKAFEGIYDNLSRELTNYNRQVMDENAARTAYAATVLDQQVDPNNPRESVTLEDGKTVQLSPPVSEQYLGNTLNTYIVDPIARTLNAPAAGVHQAMENLYNDKDAGVRQSNIDQFMSQLSGFGEGFAGAVKGDEEHRQGFGEAYELGKNRGDDILSNWERSLEREHPEIEKWIGRTAGFAGDFAADLSPLAGAGKVGVINGTRATPETVRLYARQMAERWASDVESQIITGAQKAPGNYRYYPSEQAMADHFEKTLNDVFAAGELQVNSGGSRGRYEILNPKMTAGLAGAHGSESLLHSLTVLFKGRTQKLIEGMEGRGPKLDGAALDAWAHLNPDFTDLLDNVTTQLINDGALPSNASRNMLANHLSASADTKLVRELEQQIIDQKYTPYVQQASNDIAREFRNSYYNAPGIKLGGKGGKVLPVKAVGRAFSTLESKFFDDIGKNFRYNSVFPGSLSLDTTRARAWGVRATEEFENQVREIAAPFSKADGIDIQHAIENGRISTLPPEHQKAAQWIVDQYKWMHNDEFTYGARGRHRGSQTPTTPYDPNYTFVHNKGGTMEDRNMWKRKRKSTIHDNVRKGNGEGAGRFKTSNSKAEGFRPVENAFEAVRQRRIKYNRDMIRARFLNDMVDKYGIASRISPAGKGYAAEARGLAKLDFHKLPESMRVNLERAGEEMYLPKEMANMINQFDSITRWHSGMQGRIGRSFSEVMRIIKKAQTLFWPGFHNKNMIGDIFMGLLDDIMPADYAKVIKNGMAALSGKEGTFRILKHERGLDMSFREMWHKYQSEANSGFISSELGTLEASVAKYNVPRKIAGKAESVATNISGFREDAGRFTHYVTAYKQEAEQLWKQGIKDVDRIDQMASSAALWRVNNYKFDYNALMLWEKKAKTLAFPFYTYIRKAMPTLFQALYQDPKWIGMWHRFMYSHQLPDGQESAGSFDGFRVPQDIRDTGYAFIGGQEEEPKYLTNDILPTSAFNAVRTKNMHEFFNSIMTQTALPYQIAAEQGSGQQYFQDRPIQADNFGEYLLDKVPGVREARAWTNSDKSLGEKLVQNRLGAGIPYKTLTEEQQLFAEQEWQDRMIDDPLKEINNSQDLYFIAKQTAPDGKAEIFTVKSKALLDVQGNATDVASFYTPQDAIQYVNKNMPDGYKKQPHTYDIDNQGNPIYRPVGG